VRDRVIESARRLGLEVDVRKLDSAASTVSDAARAVGCDDAQIARADVFVCDGDPVVCIASSAHEVTLDQLAEVFDCAEVRRASAGEVRAATGYPQGRLAPFGHDLPTVVDEDLLEHSCIWAPAGDGHTLVQLDPQRLVRCTGARVARIA